MTDDLYADSCGISGKEKSHWGGKRIVDRRGKVVLNCDRKKSFMDCVGWKLVCCCVEFYELAAGGKQSQL